MISFLPKIFYKIGILLIFFLPIFSLQRSFAQIKFSSICPETKIGKNEVLQIQFKVENANYVETIIPPSFKHFNVVSGPNQQSGMTSINGKIKKYVAISFYLQPESTGKFIIGSAKARADGKEFSSAPVTIEITNSSSTAHSNNNNPGNALSPFSNFNFDFPAATPTHQFDDYILKPGEDPASKIKKNLFIKLDVSKTSCYVGEPITACYKLYSRLRSESTITDAPSFNGFSVSDLDVNNNNSSIEKYNGRQYNVYILRKVQLYPLQPGSITLDPVVADNKVTFLKSAYAGTQNGDLFYDMMENFADNTSPQNTVVDETVILKSEPVNITVKPIPFKNNVPQSFKGAVGNFNIQARLEKNKITTDDAGILQVTISGQGNIQLINSPKIIWPEGIDGYDAKVKDDIDRSAVPMKGSKIFIFPFTVSKPGTYQLDSISFSYFNPSSSSYQTVKTTPLEMEIIKGKGIPNGRYGKNDAKEKNNAGFLEIPSHELIGGIALTLGIIFTTLWVLNRKNKNQDSLEKDLIIDDIKNKSVGKEAKFIIPENPLLDAHEILMSEDQSKFYHVLDISLKKYLAFKFKIPVEEVTKKRLNEELDNCNVSLGTGLLLNSLFEEIEMNLYAMPTEGNHLKSAFEKASEVVSLLDKQVCR